MKIIAGTERGRKILPPEGVEITRPIIDRVKKSLFDRLWSLGLFEDDSDDPESPLPGGAAVDIFSGTGSMGLEVLSRGFGHCVFIERDRSARSLLEKNIDNLKFTDRSTVLAGDALSGAWINQLPYRPIRLFFCDPPYEMSENPETMPQLIALLSLLAKAAEAGGVLILRTHKTVEAPAIEPWTGPARHVYGSMAIHFYVLPGADAGEADQD